jgi:hypothetical protein
MRTSTSSSDGSRRLLWLRSKAAVGRAVQAVFEIPVAADAVHRDEIQVSPRLCRLV